MAMTVNYDRPNYFVLFEHRRCQKGSRSCLIDSNDAQGLTFSVGGIGFEIRDMYNLSCPR
jgi:hypothetical protein